MLFSLATPPLPTLSATRYVQPLREGGSLPAVVETGDGSLYVVKFAGAGHGTKALVAELISALLATVLGLPTPAIALIDVPPPFGRAEPDSEIQHILAGSHGLNFGAAYLDGAFNFDLSAAGDLIGPELAARIIWFDAYITNPDRTHRNPNLLIWQRRPWLIDHGSALYVHHDWRAIDGERARAPFPLIAHHVLLSLATEDALATVDDALAPRLSAAVIDQVLALVPDAWLADAEEPSPDAQRARYRGYLTSRLAAPRTFAAAAIRARADAAARSAEPLRARR
jgi:hypothetical protein